MRPPAPDNNPTVSQSLGDVYEQMARLSALSKSLKGFHQQTLRNTDARLEQIMPKIAELEEWLRKHMTAGEPRTTEFEDKAREYLGLCYERRRLQQAQAVSDESLAELEYGHVPQEEGTESAEVGLAEFDESKHPREPRGSDKGGEFKARLRAEYDSGNRYSVSRQRAHDITYFKTAEEAVRFYEENDPDAFRIGGLIVGQITGDIADNPVRPDLLENMAKWAKQPWQMTQGEFFHPIFNSKLAHIDDRPLNSGETIGVLGDFIHGEITRSIFEPILDTPILVFDKPIQEGKIVEPREGLDWLGAGGTKGGKPIIALNLHKLDKAHGTLIEEAAHTLRRVKGRAMPRQDISSLAWEEYVASPQEQSAAGLCRYIWDVVAKQEKSHRDYVEQAAAEGKFGEGIKDYPDLLAKYGQSTTGLSEEVNLMAQDAIGNIHAGVGGEEGYAGGEFMPKSFAAGDPRRIPLSQIEPNPNQPRKAFQLESLRELATSIKEQGLLQPITVVPRNGGYMIVAGERRWRAANLAGLQEIDALVREDLDDKDVARLALLENITRKDLTPMEEARGYKALLEIETQRESPEEEFYEGIPKGGKGLKYEQTQGDLIQQGYTPEQADYLLRKQADRANGFADANSWTKTEIMGNREVGQRLEGDGNITVYRAVPKGKNINVGDYVFLDKITAEQFIVEYGRIRGQPSLVEKDVPRRDIVIPDHADPSEAIYLPSVVATAVPAMTSDSLDGLTKVTGRSLTHIKRKLSLLSLLPEFQILIEGGQLPETYGWEIARLDTGNQNEVLRWIGKGKPSIEDLRARVSVLLETQEALSIFGEGGAEQATGTKIHGNVLKQAKERYEKAMGAASRVFRDLLDQETYKVLPVVMEGRLGYQRSRIRETVKALERIDKQMAHAEQFRKKHGTLDNYLEGQTIKGVEEKSKERARQAKEQAKALKSELQEAKRAVRETKTAGGKKYAAAMKHWQAASDKLESAPRAVRALVRLADEDFEALGLADVEALLVWDDAAGETVMTGDET